MANFYDTKQYFISIMKDVLQESAPEIKKEMGAIMLEVRSLKTDSLSSFSYGVDRLKRDILRLMRKNEKLLTESNINSLFSSS